MTILGLTFNPQTEDLSEALSPDLGRLLLEKGAFVQAHDPKVFSPPREEVGLELKRVKVANDSSGSGCGRTRDRMTPLSSIAWEDLQAMMQTPRILDVRNFLDRRRVVTTGFRCGDKGVPAGGSLPFRGSEEVAKHR